MTITDDFCKLANLWDRASRCFALAVACRRRCNGAYEALEFYTVILSGKGTVLSLEFYSR